MNIFVSGGAGFIGSSLVRRWLSRATTRNVTVYDNFSSGRPEFLEPCRGDKRLRVIRGDLQDLDRLTSAIAGNDLVFHLASNPDIARAVREPDIDFWQGTYLTQNIVEAMRRQQVRRLVYTSGSGVYGERGTTPCREEAGPYEPISTYGASKLAGEALVCSYAQMFDMQGLAFRFANVVGPRQTHGVAYDFIHRLRENPSRLRILGDGRQSKSYIHVEDVLDAIEAALSAPPRPFDCYNIATGDYISVREIADLVVQRMGLAGVEYEFTGGDRGWKGDVPIVRFDLRKIRKLGWTAQRNSQQAMILAVDSMLAAHAG